MNYKTLKELKENYKLERFYPRFDYGEHYKAFDDYNLYKVDDTYIVRSHGLVNYNEYYKFTKKDKKKC